MLTVIGCGNPSRRDDGVGVEVARRLEASLTPERRRAVKVVDAGTDGMGVLLHMEGASALILVDASRSGSEPGAIYDVPGSEIEQVPAPGFTLHDFRWDHALHAGRQFHGDKFPADVRVFLIEAADLSFGLGLSPAVERAAGRVVELILERVDSIDALESVALTLRHGSLHLPFATYERFFAGLDSVLLLPRGDDLLILPVQAAAGGGQILKIVNATGDRAVSGVELFRARGVDEELVEGFREMRYEARWSTPDAALILDRFFC